MKVQPPPDVEDGLKNQWAFTLSQIEHALNEDPSKESLRYGTAIAVAISFATAVMICYGFDKLSEANAYLTALIKR